MPQILNAVRAATAIVVLAGICLPASAQKVAGLAWLAGCWTSEGKQAGSGEQWMQPVGATMLGMARTVKAGRTVDFEFMRIHESPDGRLLFTAIPAGPAEATFTQIRMSDSEIVFENTAHDFPQRVTYRRQDDARVMASIEGIRKGVKRVVEFPLLRARCAP